MRKAGRWFLLSLQFLTRIPVPVDLKATDKDYARCMIFFPITGLLIGALLAGLGYLLQLAGFTIFTAIAIVVFQCYLTGCFHVDGLSDTCDGIFSSRTKERMLEIMHDSRIGVMGAVAVIADLGLKTALLLEFMQAAIPMWKPLLGMMAFGKAASVAAAFFGNSARKEGLGKHFMDTVGWAECIGASLLSGIALVLLFGWMGAVYLATAILCAAGAKLFFTWKLGGLTGDTLGATNEGCEILFLVLCFIFTRMLG